MKLPPPPTLFGEYVKNWKKNKESKVIGKRLFFIQDHKIYEPYKYHLKNYT